VLDVGLLLELVDQVAVVAVERRGHVQAPLDGADRRAASDLGRLLEDQLYRQTHFVVGGLGPGHAVLSGSWCGVLGEERRDLAASPL
jgi:hypothetical protein